jgi:hypothetical protein
MASTGAEYERRRYPTRVTSVVNKQLQQQKPHQCGWLLKAVGFPGFPASEKPGFLFE